MPFVLFLMGILAGIIIRNLINFNETSIGVLQIDHKRSLCRVMLDELDCTKLNKKKVVLQIDHHADLSQK